MLNKYVRQWYPIKIEGFDLFKKIKNLVKIHNEPVATATWLSHMEIVKNVHENKFQSLFGGLGGDELNAGEYEYFFFRFADLKYSGQNDLLESEIAKWQEYHDHPIFKKNRQIAFKTMDEVCDFDVKGLCLVDNKRKNKYAYLLNKDRMSIKNYKPKMYSFSDSYLNNRTWQDIFYETAPCCIRAENRQSSYYGLDNFLPFYDDRLVKFMINLDGKYKIKNGITKYLLRKAMTGILPKKTNDRIKKTGWNAPSHIWFSQDAYDDIKDMLNSSKFINRGIYNINEVQLILDEHVDIVSNNLKKENHMMFFWQMINLELWMNWIEQINSELRDF